MEPRPTVAHVTSCQCSAWYDRFRSITFRTRIIKLPEEFIDYLHEDGIFLPGPGTGSGFIYGSDSEEENEDPDGEGEVDERAPSFPDLEERIRLAIEELGGQDAQWMLTEGNMRCESVADVFLLLKSSDFVAHDLSHAFDNVVDENADGPEQFELVLRKWHNINPSTEFRCFVKDQVLVAISQRDYSNHYPFLLEAKDDIENAVAAFFHDQLKDKFKEPSLSVVVFDVYLSKIGGFIYLVDINPFSATTDSLLFTWDEILNATSISTRLVTHSNGSNSNQPMFASNRVPKDLLDFSQGATLEGFASRFMDELRLATERDKEDESEE
ncbi:hypothetical protein HK101_011988 [Irineochytrium annulatum]|nr:hypothetical protein HK101_011988 [Irineochytrium annulatum]